MAGDSRLELGIEPEGEETFETLLQEEGGEQPDATAGDTDTGDTAAEGAEEPEEPNWVTTVPKEIKVNNYTLERGQKRYQIHCAVCHGMAGDGNGLVAQRAQELQAQGLASAWRPPTSLHLEAVRDQPIGKIYNTATKGKGGMAGYQEHVSLEDRWAIALYVKALQKPATPRSTN